MSKFLKRTWSVALVLSAFALGILIADKYYLRNEIIRLRVVGQSDSWQDQSVKLSVKDAVNRYLYENMDNVSNVHEAKAYLQAHTEQLRSVANAALREAGSDACANVYLTEEQTDTRHYDTFSLPAGVYETLRIDIGQARGSNWWCVVFPSLCQPVTVETFEDTAVSAGFQDGLAQTLAKEDGYQIRFYLLDCLGRLENLFHS